VTSSPLPSPQSPNQELPKPFSFFSASREVSRAEYHLWHGETIYPAGQASPWKYQLGTADSAHSSHGYRVRNASPTLGTHEANMYQFGGVTELVRAE